MRPFLGRLFLAAVNLYAVPMLFGMAFVLLDNTDQAFFELSKSAILVMLVIAPFLFVIMLLRRNAIQIAFLTPLVVAYLLYYVPFYLPKAQLPPPDSHPVRLMTYNIYVNERNPDILVNHILTSGADVVALQELSVTQAANIEARLRDLYPYMALHPKDGRWQYYRGQGVLSRYPIVADEYWQFDELPESHGHQRVELEIAGQTVVLYNTHPWPAIDWEGGFNINFDPEYDRSQSEAVNLLLERVTAETLPVIWAGDFNMTDQYEEYAQVTAHFVDTWREVGQGMGYTYPERQIIPEIIRLDYVFHDEAFQSVSAEMMLKTRTSDHRGLVVTLALLDE